jgi:hypothetical protein
MEDLIVVVDACHGHLPVKLMGQDFRLMGRTPMKAF